MLAMRCHVVISKKIDMPKEQRILEFRTNFKLLRGLVTQASNVQLI